jgi:hypothetical protein
MSVTEYDETSRFGCYLQQCQDESIKGLLGDVKGGF